MSEIVTIETPSLGDRSYLAHDGRTAIVVDPQRDIDRVEAIAAQFGVQIGLVVETHLHNDYVTGGYALAGRAGAAYAVAAGDDVAFERTPARDGDRLVAGRLSVTAMHTPGHTPHHLSWILREGSGEPLAVFTGGSMLYGSVGRTDLIGGARTEELTRAQYQSVRHLGAKLADPVEVWPAHGFGSFCSATGTTGTESTIGRERRQNVALLTDDEDAFVREITAGLGAYPRYYAHMGQVNSSGPAAPDLAAPDPVGPAELRRRIDAGEWIVDLRSRVAFARSHVAGTISVELGRSFATYVGWTIPWGTPLTLIGGRAEQVAEAQRELVRIGIDRLAGSAASEIAAISQDRTSSYPIGNFEDLAHAYRQPGTIVLDVRSQQEWAAGHITGAIHIPLWELEDRMSELPRGDVWAHCASGFRASIAASLLDRNGRSVVYVNDDWPAARRHGLPVAG